MGDMGYQAESGCRGSLHKACGMPTGSLLSGPAYGGYAGSFGSTAEPCRPRVAHQAADWRIGTEAGDVHAQSNLDAQRDDCQRQLRQPAGNGVWRCPWTATKLCSPAMCAGHRRFGDPLGRWIDTELDGQPSADALADDNTGTPDDEDGLTATTLIVGSCRHRHGHGHRPGHRRLPERLDGLEQRRRLARPGRTDCRRSAVDQRDLALRFGRSRLLFPVPAPMPASVSARRRACRTTGSASDGEVEDYKFAILAPPTVTLSVDKANIAENGGVATFTATLSYATSQDVTVKCLRRHGDADGRLHAGAGRRS